MKKFLGYSLLGAGLVGIFLLFNLFNAQSESVQSSESYCDEFSCTLPSVSVVDASQKSSRPSAAGTVVGKELPEKQVSSEGPVTVTAALVPSEENIAFDISLETHSVELSEDLVQIAVLKDDASNEYKPVSWDGDPPGGHHRSGVLTFPVITPAPVSVMLSLVIAGEERVFTWELQ